MKVSFLFTADGRTKLQPYEIELDSVPRIGEEVFTAPDALPEGMPELDPGEKSLSWRVTDVQYFITNHKKLGYVQVHLQHEQLKTG